MNLHITEGYAWNQPTSIEWKDVAYTVQRLMALQSHPHGKGTVLHMSYQHAPHSLEDQVRGWHSEILSPAESIALLHSTFWSCSRHSNSRLRLLYFKSLHAIRELVCVCVCVCVCVIAAKRTKLTSSYIQRLRFKPAAINPLWSVTWRCSSVALYIIYI